MSSTQRNILLRIQYDGTEFYGWQKQNHLRTVQGEIEKALHRLHKRPVYLLAAGRTDSGVHAVGQVVSFHTDMASIPAEKFAAALNSMLPRDVRIHSSRVVAFDFHATHHAVERCYRYYVYTANSPNPLLDRQRLRVHRQLDIPTLNAMASCLIGQHDFSSLASRRDSESMVRTVYRAHWFCDNIGFVFEIAGGGFLWKMVRTIVGTMLGCLAYDDGIQRFQQILAARKRETAGKTAPPHGLVFYYVQYPAAKLSPEPSYEETV